MTCNKLKKYTHQVCMTETLFIFTHNIDNNRGSHTMISKMNSSHIMYKQRLIIEITHTLIEQTE